MNRRGSPLQRGAGLVQGTGPVGPGQKSSLGGPGRPRPQPISGTPPPDALHNGLFLNKNRQNYQQQSLHEPGSGVGGGMAGLAGHGMQQGQGNITAGLDRCDFKTIQKTCSLFGLDLVSKNLI